MTSTIRTLITLGVLFILAGAVAAQPAGPQAASLSPNTVQRGHSAELMLAGAGFAGALAVDVPQAAGVAAEMLSAEAGVVRVKVTAAPDAAIGKRELRVIGPHGISNPVALFISQFPPIVDAEPNDDRSIPQDVRLPAVLVGAIDKPGDVDHYRFEAARGERLIFEVHAARERYATDAVLALYNTAGREVAASTNHFGADPFIAYEVPQAGVYTLAIHDLKYRGGGGFNYRITAGAIPFIEAIYPVAAQKGQAVEVEPVGYNLGDRARLKVEVGDAAGSVQVRTESRGALSNTRPLEVVTLATVQEAEPNNSADQAQAVSVPISINGRIDRAGDPDVYRFTLAEPMKVAIEAHASRYESPVDPVLTLRDAQGQMLARNDDAVGFDARIVHDLGPGQYTVTVQDLLYGGGPSHIYRLTIGPDAPPPQDFAVRFQPDALRISRGGHMKVWAEVTRIGNYTGEVAVQFEGLPPGVTIDPQPVTLGPGASGIFTLGASAEAKLGTFPIQLIATGAIGPEQAARTGEPQIANAVVQQAYVTVLDAAPFTVRAVDLTPQQLAAYSGELDALEKKLITPTAELTAQAAEWEKSLGDGPVWIVLDTIEVKSAQGTVLVDQLDGSVLATGANPASDTYTIATRTDLANITAVKLEVFADDAFPGRGPGRAPNGNFVLSTFSLQAGGADAPEEASPVKFASAFANYSQPSLTPDRSFDDDMKLGWAVGNEFGKDHWAVFQPEAAIAGHEGGTRLIFTLLQDFGGQHTIGRLRLSATTAGEVKAGPTLPAEVAAVRQIPADQRTAEQHETLTRYYMSRAPELDADRQRVALLRSIVGPSREIARLEAQLAGDHPKVDEAQRTWEQAIRNPQPLKLSKWHAVGPFEARTNEQAFAQAFPPERQPGRINLQAEYGAEKLKWEPQDDWEDGKVTVISTTVRSALYLYRRIEVDVPRRIELSLGSDDGIKVWHNGQQVLANSTARAAMPDQEKLTLDLAPGTNTLLMKIANAEGGSAFYFRVANSDALPQEIAAIVSAPVEQRTTEQQVALRSYYRSLDPTLKPIRDRLETLQSQFSATFPPVTKRREMVAVSVAIEPKPGFDAPVMVTLEGYVAGRDGAGMPAPISGQIDVKPATLTSGGGLGILSLTPKDQAEFGTRNVVLRAEAKVGDVTWVQYSPAFTLTIRK